MASGFGQITFKDATNLICRWSSDKEIIVDDVDRYTGHRLNQEARSIAQALLAQDISKGDVVAFMGVASCRFFAAYFGAHKTGVTTCNIHVKESPEFIARTLESIDAKVLIFSSGLESIATAAIEIGEKSIPVLSLGDTASGGVAATYTDMINDYPAKEPSVEVSPSDSAIIILSSGSTGVPKGILHNHRNFIGWLRASSWLFGAVDRSTRFLVNVATSFAAWPFSAIPALFGGGTIILMEGFTPERFCQLVEKEKVTMAGPVPTMIRMLTPDITSKYDLGSFRMVLCAGEPPTASDIERVLSWADTDIRCLYLASESAPGAATYWELRDRDELGKSVCAGRPIPGSDIRVVDPDGSIDDEMLPCEQGEIVLTGPTISQGYLNNEELTDKKFVGRWWRSGDLGYLDEDGYLFVEGRTDNVINTGGIKVMGEEVESCLILHPAVQQAAVIGVPDDKWGQRIVAHVVSSSEVSGEELLEFCKQQGLTSFKRPKQFIMRDSLPVGVVGKLDRVSLREESQ